MALLSDLAGAVLGVVANSKDPTDAIRRTATTFPGVEKGASCTQSAFKAGKGTFLFIGPGPKGVGFKAMFKLKASLAQAQKLAAQHPKRFEVGTTGWVTARFTTGEPLPEQIWGKWLAESYDVTCGTDEAAKKTRRIKSRRS
jgi:hypothetical protein